MSIRDGSSTTFTTPQHLAALSIGSGQTPKHRGCANAIPLPASVTLGPGGGNTLVVRSLVIAGAPDAWTGRLDLSNNDLIVQASPADPQAVLATLTNQIKSGRTSPGPLWTGQGITTSAAGAYTTLGITINDRGAPGQPKPLFATFSGQAVSPADILIKYTYNGDANLDGLVNADDYFQIDSGFISQKPGWYNGDFNYDGVMNADDYFMIDSAFIGQTGVLAGMGRVAAVPEAGAVGMVVLLGMGMMGRRKRR